MKSGKLAAAVFAALLMFSACITGFAQGSTQQAIVGSKFKDMAADHWANEAVTWMTERNILSGYPDMTFKPDNAVTRAEFAKIMVLALNLQLTTPQTPSFKDIPADNWAYQYVETARPYLTGFRGPGGDFFKPSIQAVREDMAVALIKAKGYSNEAIDENLLNVFKDKEDISFNLRKYVAIAVDKGIMEGSSKDGNRVFEPQGILTRAQAAKLLYNVVKDEKVTYDEPKSEEIKIVNDDYIQQSDAPVVSANSESGKIVIRWTPAKNERFMYYKVVASKHNPNPKYPENGYLYCITDINTTQAVIDNSQCYDGGDFGGSFASGQNYYFTVTAVYEDRKVTGNAVEMTFAGNEGTSTEYQAPNVSLDTSNGKTILRWDMITDKRLQGYKVVISKYDSTPVYPENGYFAWITDRNKTYCVIGAHDKYNSGDFGKYLIPGEKYYFSVTAVYDCAKIPGNVIFEEFVAN